MATLVLRAACAIATLCLASAPALAQRDPGIRGGFQNTAGMLQYRGIPIPPPPVISPHPTTGATITANELASFKEGILRAGQLEATCDECAMVTEGTPVTGRGELDPTFPQFTTNSNGLGARHNADQCFGCHAQPTLGGSGGFLVPNPGPQGHIHAAAAREPDVPAVPVPLRQEERGAELPAAIRTDPRGPLHQSGGRSRATSSATRMAIPFPMAA